MHDYWLFRGAGGGGRRWGLSKIFNTLPWRLDNIFSLKKRVIDHDFLFDIFYASLDDNSGDCHSSPLAANANFFLLQVKQFLWENFTFIECALQQGQSNHGNCYWHQEKKRLLLFFGLPRPREGRKVRR